MALGMGGMYMPGANVSNNRGNLGNNIQHMPPEYLAQVKEQNRIQKLINAYKASPQSYSESEGLQLQQLAVGAGIPFEIESSAGARWGKALASLADTALFGLLPNELYTPVNAAEKKAVAWGSTAGMLLPWGGPARLVGAGANVLRGVRAGKGLKGLKSMDTLDRASAGFWNPTKMLKTSRMFGGTGKNPIDAAGKLIKTTAKRKSKPLYTGKTDKEFFTFMGSTTKKGKGFRKAVAMGKTPAEKEKLGLAWLKKEMGAANYKRIGVKRLKGWLKKHTGVKSKTKKMTKAQFKKNQMKNPATGKPFTDKEVIQIGGGTKQPKNQVFFNQVRDDLKSGKSVIKDGKIIPNPNRLPEVVTTKTAPKGSAAVRQQAKKLGAGNKNKVIDVKYKEVPKGGKKEVMEKMSNSLKRKMRSGKQLSPADTRKIMSLMDKGDKAKVLKIKDKKQRSAAVKRWLANIMK